MSEGPNAKTNRQEAEFFAQAPVMADLLAFLVQYGTDINEELLGNLVERAERLLKGVHHGSGGAASRK